MPQFMRSMLLRYGTTVLAVVLVLLLKPLLEHGIFALFLSTVILSAWYGGPGPGLLATVLSALSINYFLLSPTGRLTPDGDDISQLSVFVLIVVLINSLSGTRKRAEDKLRESEVRYRIVAESANDAIVFADGEGRIIAWNGAAQRIFLFAEAEVLGQPLSMIIPERYRQAHRQGWERYRRTGIQHIMGRAVELHGLRKDGSEFPLELSLSSWETERGELFSGVIRDLTERKRNDEALRTLSESLKKSDELKSALLASVSHDLRSPLTSMRAAADSLLDRELNLDPDTLHELHLIVGEGVSRLTRLVEDLLAMARVEAGALQLSTQWTSPADICSDVLDRCASELRDHRVSVECAEDLPSVKVDPRLVAEALTHLVENAAKYSPRGSEITVRAQFRSDELLMSATDQGPGIPPEERDRIFDKFYRSAHRSGQQCDGTGMGLAIARGIIEAHGGRIWVESAPNRGATFTFALMAEYKRVTDPERLIKNHGEKSDKPVY
jgi:PAS domain S-box-containing protein